MNKPMIVASPVPTCVERHQVPTRPDSPLATPFQRPQPAVPGVTKADLMGLFVDGALDSKLRASAHRALNKLLGLYSESNGGFTACQVERLLDAADRYLADPANQVDLTRPMLVRKIQQRAIRRETRLGAQSA